MRWIAALFCSLAFGLPAAASDDHDAARAALREDKVLPLAEIVPMVEDRFGGRMLDAEFEHKHGAFVYELEIIQESGRMIEVVVDAASGDILEVEQKRWLERDDG